MRAQYISAVHHFGAFMQRHKGAIQAIQWFIVALYLILLIIPAFMTFPPNQAHILNSLVRFAQFVFWGIWWPFVILSMLFMGRIWCGVFCPEGVLTEWTSKTIGRNKTLPRWIKWKGWPAVAFVLTTLYGQLISVYDYAEAALLILGGSTVGAMIIGYLYGKGTRVWCRFLCPVNGVFNLLSRLAPFAFKTDQDKWAEFQGKTVNPQCAPVINIHQLHGVSGCHMCGRCDGMRGAVSLEPRSMMEEVVVYGGEKNNIWETRLLLFGMIGVAIGAFTWTVDPWFIAYKQNLAAWLINRDIYWPFATNAPWWILTNHDGNDNFNWLDGFCITTYILGIGLGYGMVLSLLLRVSVFFAGNKTLYNHLAQALIPLAAAGLFLGLTATTIKLLQFDRISFWGLSNLRAFILGITTVWSLYLAAQILRRADIGLKRWTIAFIVFAISTVLIVYAWWLMFWGW